MIIARHLTFPIHHRTTRQPDTARHARNVTLVFQLHQPLPETAAKQYVVVMKNSHGQYVANCCNYPSFHFSCWFQNKFITWDMGSIHPSIHVLFNIVKHHLHVCTQPDSALQMLIEHSRGWHLKTVSNWHQQQIAAAPLGDSGHKTGVFCSTICVKILTGHCYFRGLWIGYNLGTILDLHHLFQWKS